ncbi:MAG: 3-dehydroquinate synthase [Planctomycetaceae bacterium]|nr:3-dehydroquinate synthase [Planctomycetaceae bacterium]
MDNSSHILNVDFHVPFVHRLRFTSDVFGEDQAVLTNLLESSDENPARVQFWIDQNVAEGSPQLIERVKRFSNSSPDLVQRVGSIQFVPGGEEIKNDIHILERMLKVFNVCNLDRRSYIVAIGGGAVLDAVGFAVAIAHRGLRLVRIPTTTLSQADSGIGVKNSVNLFAKKNWLGTFAVPWGVINDTEMLTSLSNRDFVNGFSEAVKVSLLKSPQVFEQICVDATSICDRDMSKALPVIKASAKMHLDHITRGNDPFEMLEARPLDYGHWSAHKMETMSDFTLRHGEAVAIGVAIDTVYSSLEFGLDTAVAQRVMQCLCDLGFSLTDATLNDVDTLFRGLEEFRQHLGGRLTLTMLEDIGKPIDVHSVNRSHMLSAIEQVKAYAESRQHVN